MSKLSIKKVSNGISHRGYLFNHYGGSFPEYKVMVKISVKNANKQALGKAITLIL